VQLPKHWVAALPDVQGIGVGQQRQQWQQQQQQQQWQQQQWQQQWHGNDDERVWSGTLAMLSSPHSLHQP
jgi:hypothetical protein